MDFIKKLLQTNQERGRASIQMTVESDFNLPDYEPDMIKLIDRKGAARIRETRVDTDSSRRSINAQNPGISAVSRERCRFLKRYIWKVYRRRIILSSRTIWRI